MDMKDRLNRLETEIKSLESRRERLLGQQDQLTSQLKDFGFDTVEVALKHVDFLKNECSSLEERLEKSITEIEEQLNAID